MLLAKDGEHFKYTVYNNNIMRFKFSWNPQEAYTAALVLSQSRLSYRSICVCNDAVKNYIITKTSYRDQLLIIVII